MRSKKVVAFVRMLPGFRDVDGNPSFAVNVKIRPTMVAGDFGRMLVGRQREPDLKPRGNSLRSRHGNKKGMEVGTVALLGVAGVEHVAVSPACAGLVVFHGGEDVV